MYSRIIGATIVGMGLLVGSPLRVLAEQEHSGHMHEGQAGVQMSSEAGQGHCEHCQQSTKDLDEVLAKLDKAKQSNDIAEIRATLDEVQQPLAQLKEHMATCPMKMSKAEGMCPMCKIKLDKDGRCPQCGMKM